MTVGCLKCMGKIIWVENVIPDQSYKTNSTVTLYVRYTLLLCMDPFQAHGWEYVPRWDKGSQVGYASPN